MVTAYMRASSGRCSGVWMDGISSEIGEHWLLMYLWLAASPLYQRDPPPLPPPSPRPYSGGLTDLPNLQFDREAAGLGNAAHR